MSRYLERLQQEHRRLNRLIDNCRDAARQNEMKALKRLRLNLNDKIAQFPRAAGLVFPSLYIRHVSNEQHVASHTLIATG